MSHPDDNEQMATLILRLFSAPVDVLFRTWESKARRSAWASAASAVDLVFARDPALPPSPDCGYQTGVSPQIDNISRMRGIVWPTSRRRHDGGAHELLIAKLRH